jgi:LysR family transcriptional regulator, glycine cleavage system transcriptional activator
MKLPPLSALRAFDAAARHGSFSRAADELHVTHGAVSRHIAALETHFGKALFIRHARGVASTEAGRRFQEAVGEALERLAAGAREVRTGERPALVEISVLPSFATQWLLPRLPQFKRAHPGIEIHIKTEHELVDLRQRASATDFAIRYGLGAWKGLHAERLLPETLCPVCAPELTDATLDIAALLSRHPLIHDSNDDAWMLWFSSTGIRPPRRAPRALTFNDYNLVVEAAVQGLGVALGRSGLIERTLDEGRLVRCAVEVAGPKAHHLVRRAQEPLRKQARSLWDWLLRIAQPE